METQSIVTDGEFKTNVGAFAPDREPAGHPQMKNDGFLAFEVDEEIFPVSIKSGDNAV
jgi:hypothetical protein